MKNELPAQVKEVIGKDKTNWQPTQEPEIQSISFKNKQLHDPKKIAKVLNSWYTPSAKVNSHNLLRSIQRPTINLSINIPTSMTEKKVKKRKSSKAIAPDIISLIMLKHPRPAKPCLYDQPLQQKPPTSHDCGRSERYCRSWNRKTIRSRILLLANFSPCPWCQDPWEPCPVYPSDSTSQRLPTWYGEGQ